MTMTKKYKILSKFVKDMSSETPNVETYLHVKDHISKYQLNIEINSKAIKNELIEINTTFQFKEPQEKSKKSFFENLFKKNFRLIGNININPNISVANPGMINKRAAKAMAAPDIIS